MHRDTTINVELKITPKERKRIVLEYLEEKFLLNYDWEENEIVVYENCYHNDTCRRVVGKVTKEHKLAQKLHDFLLEDKRD